MTPDETKECAKRILRYASYYDYGKWDFDSLAEDIADGNTDGVAEEREECARVAESWSESGKGYSPDYGTDGARVAELIRARGKDGGP